MDPIYVTGHRNPDTDSIVSAMAYAALRNALGDREYRAARLGHVSDETQLVLDRFGFPAPVWIKTMRTQVRDLDYDTPPALSSGVTISRAWAALSTDTSIAALPITNEDGTLFGMLSSGDIAASDMQSIEHPAHRRRSAVQCAQRARGPYPERSGRSCGFHQRRRVHRPAAEL